MNMSSPQGETSTGFDVFISYCSRDVEDARALAELLDDTGIVRPFFDQWHVVPGEPVQEALERAVTETEAIVVVVGARGLGPWQTEEIRAAIARRIKDNGVRIIPVLLPSVEDGGEDCLPPLLQRFSRVVVDPRVRNERAIERLVAGIQGRAPGRRVATEITSESMFTKRSTLNLIKSHSDLDLGAVRVDSQMPLLALARLVWSHNPSLSIESIFNDLIRSRSLAYDEKYATRSSSHDERYLDFAAWERELHGLLLDTGIRDPRQVDVVNVGIGNGLEAPHLYQEFRSLRGVDISRESLQLAVERMPFVVPLNQPAEDLADVGTSTADLYLSLRTYQSSFFDIETSALEAGRVVRNDGSAIVSIPHLYVEHGALSRGLQHRGTQTLDPDLPWVIADRTRRAFHRAEFECEIRTGLFEIYVVGKR